MALRIRKNDTVEVISGAHKGARGKVLLIDGKKDRVVIEGVNLVYRHVKPSRKNPQGGRVQQEAALHISNVMPVDPSSGKSTRVSFVTERDNKGRVQEKSRRARKGSTVLHTLKTTSE